MTRLGQTGIGQEPYQGFQPKAPNNKGTGPFTRLITIGIGGRRVAFLPKGTTSTLGVARGAKGARKRKLTYEELLRMDAFGRAQLGILEPETNVAPEILVTTAKNVSPTTQDISILEPVIDEDILLILAILEAHNG